MLTVPEVKDYLRYEPTDTESDGALAIILDGGVNWIERYTGHIFVQRQVEEAVKGGWSYRDLRWRPYLADSLAIAYFDSVGVPQPYANFVAFPANGHQRVNLTGALPGSALGVSLTYMAGYADPDDIPAAMIHALAIYAGMSDLDRTMLAADSQTSLHFLLQDFRSPVLA